MNRQQWRDPQYQNFVTVFRGFAYVGKKLEPYTEAGLRRAHQKAYRAAAGHPPCLQQCSHLHGRATVKWCGACKTWMNTLLHNRRGSPFRNWENTESWNWGTDYDTIAAVYLPPSWGQTELKLNDLGTACHLWSTCKEFNIGFSLLKRLRELRNKLYGHNPDMKIIDTEKTKVFDALKCLLRESDVQSLINVAQCDLDLDNIADGDELQNFTQYAEEQFHQLNKNMSSINDTEKLNTICLKSIQFDTKRNNKVLTALENNVHCRKGLLILALVIFLTTTGLWIAYPRPNHQGVIWFKHQTECLSEMYSYPFRQDLPLLPYMNEHSMLLGRKWLFEDIRKYVGKTSSTDKGVLLTADIGYGKSAIVKHLLCAGKDDEAFKIRAHIIAFHMCKFDVPSTKDPQRFLYRLIGFLSTFFPEFGGIISTIPETALLYDREKCNKEIVACFDQGILHPLHEMKYTDSDAKVIVIDALDECYDKRSDDNDLYQLLISRYRKLPNWIKLIITSRNISQVSNFKLLKHSHLDSNDKKNIADIKTFIDLKVSLNPMLGKIEGGLDALFRESGGNFLFVVHLIEYLNEKNDGKITDIPETLFDIYEVNFDRVFHFSDYKVAQAILEVIIASLHPLNKEELVNILEHTDISKREAAELTLEKIIFCFRSFQELTFVHQSLQSWLLSAKNRLFLISEENGHSIFSRYLLSQVNHSRDDIIDIAIHVGSSSDPTLVKAFAASYSSKNVTSSTLHKLVWKSDSQTALELILDLQVDVDALNEGNVTAAFVAAARGHLNQLKVLLSRGANLDFKVNDSYLITSSKQIDIIKHDYYFGYGLVHIAAQFGQLNIVKFLVEQSKTMLYSKNGLGLSSIDIACENGHLNIFDFLFNSNSDVKKCLFYAAKNGHIHIINRLINLGINVTCVSQDDALEATTVILTIDHSKSILAFHSDYESMPLLNAVDLWWVAYKQTPLHAAISAKSEPAAKLLLKHYPHLAECVDAFGMTPFLVSVIENQVNVFEVMIERVTKDQCQIIHTWSDSERPVCPVGGSYSHLDGIHGRFDMTKMILRRHIQVDWFLQDANLDTAVHYAACRGNINFLFFMKLKYGQSFSDIRSANRSTPYHSAAICGSISALYAMTDLMKNPIPNVMDIENRTIIHYSVMRELYDHPATLARSHNVKSILFINDSITSGINVDGLDTQGRNLLHYALRNGHFLTIEYIFWNLNTIYNKLIRQKDIYKNSPLEYAIKTVDSQMLSNPVMSPKNCSFFDVFFTPCGTGNEYLSQYLSTWEMGIVTVMQTATNDIKNELIMLFNDIFLKSPYLTSAVLVYLREELNLQHIQKQFVDSISESPPLLSIYALARHRPALFSICGKVFTDSPLHMMTYKYDHLLTRLDFLHLAFGNPLNTSALGCADSRGYNSFHYALIGGNIRTAIHLFKIGVTIFNSNVPLNEIPWMILSSKKQVFAELDKVCADQLSCMDRLLHKILRKYTKKIIHSDLCQDKSTGLSLVHLVAVSGLQHSLKYMYETFGVQMLKCRNRDSITPLYLWNLFNNKTAKGAFELTSKRVPNPDTEKFLLLWIVEEFPFGKYKSSPAGCLIDKNGYPKHNMIKCFSRSTPTNKYIFILKRLINVQLDFAMALRFQQVNLQNVLQEITAFKSTFQSYFTRLRLPFNYPRLKELFNLTLNATQCKHNGQLTVPLPCLQIYSELNHASNRIIDLIRNILLLAHLHTMHTSHKPIPEHFQFMRKRMEKIQANSPKFLENFLSARIESLEYAQGQSWIVARHRYLNILKETVKYQYVKEEIESSLLKDKALKLPFNLNVKKNIPKPFEDIFKYLNDSSYHLQT